METLTDNIDIELALAQKALGDAQERKARADKMALDKAAAELAAHKAAEEKRLADLRKEAEEAQERARKRKQDKEAAERAAEATRKAEEDRLAREVSVREETLRKEAERAALIRKVQEQAFAVEQEAKRVEAELLRKQNTEPEAPPVTSLHDPRHPFSMIFGRSSENYQEPAQGFDSVEQAKRQKAEDTVSHVSDHKPQRPRYFVDKNDAVRLQNLWHKKSHYRPNDQQIDNLLTRWTAYEVETAFNAMIIQLNSNPMGIEQQVGIVVQLLGGIA